MVVWVRVAGQGVEVYGLLLEVLVADCHSMQAEGLRD